MPRVHPSHAITVTFTCLTITGWFVLAGPRRALSHPLLRLQPHVVEHESQLADRHAVRERDGQAADTACEVRQQDGATDLCWVLQ